MALSVLRSKLAALLCCAALTLTESLAAESTPSLSDTVPTADVAEHLARHDLEVSAARTVLADRVTPADALLGYAADNGCDLLVTGAYGHSRTREMVLGGVTRDLLRYMTLPVLMAH